MTEIFSQKAIIRKNLSLKTENIKIGGGKFGKKQWENTLTKKQGTDKMQTGCIQATIKMREVKG